VTIFFQILNQTKIAIGATLILYLPYNRSIGSIKQIFIHFSIFQLVISRATIVLLPKNLIKDFKAINLKKEEQYYVVFSGVPHIQNDK
jgi:hypothetical protein